MEVENVERNPGELKSVSTLLIARLTNAAKGGGDSESTKDMAPWKTIAKTSLTTSLINKEFKTRTSIVDAFFTTMLKLLADFAYVHMLAGMKDETASMKAGMIAGSGSGLAKVKTAKVITDPCPHCGKGGHTLAQCNLIVGNYDLDILYYINKNTIKNNFNIITNPFIQYDVQGQAPTQTPAGVEEVVAVAEVEAAEDLTLATTTVKPK
jgi:hypothetical protein